MIQLNLGEIINEIRLLREQLRINKVICTEKLNALVKFIRFNINAFSESELGLISCELANIKEWEFSIELAYLIKNKNIRGITLSHLSSTLIEANSLDKAEQLINSISTEKDYIDAFISKITAMIELTKALVFRRQVKQAKEILDNIEKHIREFQETHFYDTCAEFFNDIAKVWIKLNQEDKAVQLWHEAIQSANQSFNQALKEGIPLFQTHETYQHIAASIAKTGKFTFAREMVKSMKDELGQQQALKVISDFEKN